GAPSTRSSVGSVTNISGPLRLLYSRVGHYPPGAPMLFAEDFSSNTPQGACPQCHGQGRVYDATEASMVPDDSLTIRQRAIAAWPPAWHGQNLRDILVSMGIDVDVPWRDLPKKTRDWILYTEETPTVPVWAGLTPAQTRTAKRKGWEPSYTGTFTGARRYVLHTFATTQSATVKRRVARYLEGAPCRTCGGRRLKPEALSVTFAGVDLGTLSRMPLEDVAARLAPAAQGRLDETADADDAPLDRAAARRDTARRVAAGGSAHAGAPDVRRTGHLSPEKRIAAQRLARDALARIATMRALGLGYLSLDRSTPTLSPGELQRLRLATQLRSNLFGVVYVLDEPSAGLHPADAEALHEALDGLKRAGNTVYVVEHDLETMRRADWLVDVGPDAGERGGRIVYSGPPAGLADVADSRTAPYLFAAGAPEVRPPREPSGWLEMKGVTRNNLRSLDVRLPLGTMTAVTGVSGSGKSSLASRALVDLVGAHLGHEPPADESPEPTHEPLPDEPTAGRLGRGADAIGRLVQVDQKPIGRTPRSNLATYTGLFDAVRRLFAATPRARELGYDAGRFSFNVASGRCATCEGEGFVEVELLFMPSVYAPCPACRGSRYDASTLEVTWRGLNVAQVLALTVEEACDAFADQAAIARPLALLRDIGLGYLRLGQPATELSGGEAQRIKLATELQRSQRGDTLYVLDEPTTGLHPADVDRLMRQLDALVEAGNTVVLVEHDLRVIARCDWVIDLGPGAGDRGGRIVDEGPPAAIAARAAGPTGAYLRRAGLAGR
ncbi:MAG TPA: excinuclease ABC subunit A, partial [Burkholderiaceae bacterium]|nr:excinuclease ABC subunit A [Burkholderiaceae bacterium]